MKRFNPKNLPPLPDRVSAVPQHGVAWSRKWTNWWAGATIASPTTDMAAPAAQAVKAVRRFIDDIDRLNEYYRDQTDYARTWVRRVLDEPDETPVILDASGTSAILLASRLFAHLAASGYERKDGSGGSRQLAPKQRFFTITTDEGGTLVPVTLKGRDPNEVDRVMFQPSAALFFQPQPVLEYPRGVEVESRVVNLTRNDNAQVVEEIRRLAIELGGDGGAAGCIMLPMVSKTGRILPVKEVAAIVEELRVEGLDRHTWRYNRQTGHN